MSYLDLRDFDPEFITTEGDLTIQLEKLGGGTVGRSYEGKWRYVVYRNGEEIARGQDLHTGTPKTHQEAAEIVCEFVIMEEGR